MTCNAKLDLPLFHGTSSLFIESILEHGLGGQDPIATLKVRDFSEQLLPIAEEHLASNDDYLPKLQSFGLMIGQHKGAMNFEHGQTYLSPSKLTAVRYASNNSYGSEILSSAIDFLRILWLKDVPAIKPLFQSYPQICGLLDLSPAPLLIEAKGVSISDLQSESGGDPTEHVRLLKEISETDMIDVVGQQSNFRLVSPVPCEAIKVYLINVTRWHPGLPEYKLYQLKQ